MVLKVGLYRTRGVQSWKYFENITDLNVSPSDANDYYFEKATHRVKLVEEKDKDIDLTNCVDCMFDEGGIDPDRTNVSLVEFIGQSGDQFRLVCVWGTVYLMNNEGKTIDRF